MSDELPLLPLTLEQIKPLAHAAAYSLQRATLTAEEQDALRGVIAQWLQMEVEAEREAARLLGLTLGCDPWLRRWQMAEATP